ncbi:hypothetical protein ABR853_20955, partial [Aeromonas caviae]
PSTQIQFMNNQSKKCLSEQHCATEGRLCSRDCGPLVTAGVQILQNLRGAWMLRRDIEPGGAQLHGDAVFARFAAIPDVVEHGLFLNGIDTIVIARGDTMEVRRRGQARSR